MLEEASTVDFPTRGNLRWINLYKIAFFVSGEAYPQSGTLRYSTLVLLTNIKLGKLFFIATNTMAELVKDVDYVQSFLVEKRLVNWHLPYATFVQLNFDPCSLVDNYLCIGQMSFGQISVSKLVSDQMSVNQMSVDLRSVCQMSAGQCLSTIYLPSKYMSAKFLLAKCQSTKCQLAHVCPPNVCQPNVCLPNVCWQNVCHQKVCWPNA